MSDNLPPGVTPSMIPGNRPEDEWWEAFTEQLEDSLPGFVYEYDPGTLAARIGMIMELVEGFVNDGFASGRQEGRIDAEEAAHDRMQEAEARLRREGLIEDDDGPMGSGIGAKMMGSNKED